MTRLVFVLAVLASGVLHAATIVVLNGDAGTGLGFDDPTVVAPVAGNPATTRGAQRLNAFEAAAAAWGAILQSDVTIQVEATMNPVPALFCAPNSATLGSAGPRVIYSDFTNAPVPDTWYPVALANSLAGTDLSGSADISARFNPLVDEPACLSSLTWSYVIDAPNPGGTLKFTSTVLHELAHGLGFVSFVDETDGSYLGGQDDHYSRHLLDETPSPTLWSDMNNAGRAASAIDSGNLTWSGSEVAKVSGSLVSGAHASSGRPRLYAPNPVRPGSSVSHWDLALSPSELMEPNLNSTSNQLLTNHLMLDIGWRALLAISVSKTDNLDTVEAGSEISYSVSFTNNGPANLTLTSAPVTDFMPAALTNVSWICSATGGATCSDLSGTGSIISSVTLPLGGSTTYTILATIDPGFSGILSNTASISLPANISNTLPSSATDDTTVTASNVAGITVSPVSGLVTDESGGSDGFTVVLDSQPGDDVTIQLTSLDPGEGSVSPSSLTFTHSNWSTPQPVLVTGQPDGSIDGDVGYTIQTGVSSSNDGAYDGIDPDDVSVTNTDVDRTTISVADLNLAEGDGGGHSDFAFTISLAEPDPFRSVTMDYATVAGSASSGVDYIHTQGQLTFVPGTTQETIHVPVSRESLVELNEVFTLQLSNPVNATLADGSATGTISNDDGATLAIDTVSRSEGDSGSSSYLFTVTLDNPVDTGLGVDFATADGTASVADGDYTGLTGSLSFTGAPGETQQFSVSVTGDSRAEADETFTVSLTAVNANGREASIGTSPGFGIISNDDFAGTQVSPLAGLLTSESGASDTFSIVLTSQPAATVTIPLFSSNTGEGMVSPPALIFEPDNWNTPQIATITGQDDPVLDGDTDYLIFVDPLQSSDGDYLGIDPPDVAVRNADNESDVIFKDTFEGASPP